MTIEISGIKKAFMEKRKASDFKALKGLDLTIEQGDFVALLGPSGSGKTTLLRIIAGLEKADAGMIKLNGLDITNQPPMQRKIGFVFQHYALFRHMTVARNIGFGLNIKPSASRLSRAVIKDKVDHLIDMMQLHGLEDRYPSQLSGGQSQRVALARVLAIEPKVLLLDEPFGALDTKIRKDLRQWLRQLHDKTNITTLFVTHDQEEAMAVAHKIAVLKTGRLEQFDTPQEIYDHPATPFVFDFIGNKNVIELKISNHRAYIGDFAIDMPDIENGRAFAYIRPHAFSLEGNSKANTIKARVIAISINGPLLHIEAMTGDIILKIEIIRRSDNVIQINDVINLIPDSIKIFRE